MTKLPNYFPPKASAVRLAIIGEMPVADDFRAGRPFASSGGALLSELLWKQGVSLTNCYLGNVCQSSSTKFSDFGWDSDEIQEGLAALRADLAKFRPSVIVTLGAGGLRAARHGNKASVENYRGSLFTDTPWGVPTMVTVHPMACFKDFSLRVLLRFDLARALHVLAKGPPPLPAERYELDVSGETAARLLAKLRKAKKPVAVDLEGYPGDLRCISFAWTPEDAFCIGGDTLAEPRTRAAFEAFLADPAVPKIFHNGLYDRFVLGWQPWGLPVAQPVEDTMLAQWELSCEMPKALSHCGSVHTWRPYWKGDKSATDRLTLQRYCCRDTTATVEIWRSQQAELAKEPGSLRHYHFNLRTLDPLLDMELTGIRYDSKEAARRRNQLQAEAFGLQAELDELTGVGVPDRAGLDKALLGLCMVRSKITDPAQITPEVVRKEWRQPLARIQALAAKRKLAPAERGELSTLLKLHRNCESVAFRTYLYSELKLPKQYKKTPLGPVLSANETALLRLRRLSKHPVIPLALRLRTLGTRIQMLGIRADEDGRIRCGYNPVGQETGRVSCYTSPTGSGYNLTTIPEADRDLFLADPDCWLAQCDLAGADGWTVAANLAALGAPAMLEDLRAGIKPAKVIVLMWQDPKVAQLSRPALLEACKSVAKSDPRYAMGKKTQHGSSYLMGARTCANGIFLESGGEIDASEKDMAALQRLFELRYRPSLWHGAVQRVLKREGSAMSVPSGHKRKFLNWPDKRLTEALAHEPQANTTYVTNLTLVRCWEDPENRDKHGRRIVQPKHHVHDALLFQFPRAQLAFAKRKIAEWFNNPLVIAGIPLVIPYEGAYGKSWGDLTEGTL